MTNEPTLIEEAPPAWLTDYTGDKINNDEFQAPGGAPIAQLSIKGGKWIVRRKDMEPQAVMTDGYAAPYVDVVIVAANPNIVKIYYDRPFKENEFLKPACASVDGIRPDIGVPSPQSGLCRDCDHNKFGTAKRQDGTPGGGKACADKKRVVVVPAADMSIEPYLLLIPADSLGALEEYRIAQTRANPPRALFVIVTRLSFDPKTAYPKIEFNRVRWISNEEVKIIEKWRKHPHTERMLTVTSGSGALDTGPDNIVEPGAPVSDTAATAIANAANSVAAKAAAERAAENRVSALKAAQVTIPNGEEKKGPPLISTKPTVATETQTDPLAARKAAIAKAQANAARLKAEAAEAEAAALAAEEEPTAPEAEPAPAEPSSQVPSIELLKQLDSEFASIPD